MGYDARGMYGIGVTYESKSDRYRARIYIDGRSVSLGRHRTMLLAQKAYDKAAMQHFGPKAEINGA